MSTLNLNIIIINSCVQFDFLSMNSLLLILVKELEQYLHHLSGNLLTFIFFACRIAS